MITSKSTLVGILVSLGLAGSAYGQSRLTQIVELPADVVVFVLPMEMTLGRARPSFVPVLVGNPEPSAMMRQMRAMMANARQLVNEAGALPEDSGVAGVTVTTISDGYKTCTRRVTYRGNGSAPIVQVGGDGCAGGSVPATLPQPLEAPQFQPPRRAAPRTLEVRAPSAPMQFASAR